MPLPFIFKKKSIVTQETLGEKLKKIRLGKNWTLHDASRHTKIASRYLEFLEKTQYDTFPGEVYIKNFIRTYSKTLGFNPDSALIQYAKEQHVIEQKKHNWFFKEIEKLPILDKLLKPSVIQKTIICLIILGVLSYLSFNIYRTVAPPSLIVVYPKQDIEIYAPFITVLGKSDAEATVFVNDKEVITKDDGTFKEQVILRYGLNRIIVSAKRKHGFISKEVRHVLVNKEKTVAKQK